MNERKTLSYSSTYKFYVSQDYTIEAVFVNEGETVEATPTANIVQTKCFEENGVKKIHFVSMLTVPEGCTIEYGGILATTNGDKVTNGKLDPETADFVRGKQSDAKTLRFTWTKTNVTDNQTWYMKLNETSEFIARQLMEDITEEALVDAVCARYEVERERAAGSVRRSLEELEKWGLLEEK